MALTNWVLPILIGIVASVLLLAILYNPYIKNKFSDLGALIQLQTSRPVYYVPLNYYNQLSPVPEPGYITSTNSPLYPGNAYPVYNYYPQTPLNKNVTVTNSNSNSKDKLKNKSNQNNKNNNAAFVNPDGQYDPHKAYYWALSGGYPYPVMYFPSTDMDKVKGIEDKI
jgi:hypothetical protein